MSINAGVGALALTVQTGYNFEHFERHGLMKGDPHPECTIVYNGKEVFKTGHKAMELQADWAKSGSVELLDLDQRITFRVYDHHALKKSVFVGEGYLYPRQLSPLPTRVTVSVEDHANDSAASEHALVCLIDVDVSPDELLAAALASAPHNIDFGDVGTSGCGDGSGASGLRPLMGGSGTSGKGGTSGGVDNRKRMSHDAAVLLGITDEEFEGITAAMSSFDLDNDRVLTAAEVVMSYAAAGVAVTDEEAAAIVSESDLNGSGTISVAEFLAFTARKVRLTNAFAAAGGVPLGISIDDLCSILESEGELEAFTALPIWADIASLTAVPEDVFTSLIVNKEGQAETRTGPVGRAADTAVFTALDASETPFQTALALLSPGAVVEGSMSIGDATALATLSIISVGDTSLDADGLLGTAALADEPVTLAAHHTAFMKMCSTTVTVSPLSGDGSDGADPSALAVVSFSSVNGHRCHGAGRIVDNPLSAAEDSAVHANAFHVDGVVFEGETAVGVFSLRLRQRVSTH